MDTPTLTITCPKCGANPSNRMNCEYCGSMLVRFAERRIRIDESKYGKTARVIPGLIDALSTNLSIQKPKTEGILPVCEVVSNNAVYQILPTGDATFGINIDNPFCDEDYVGITLRMPFLTRSFDSNVANYAKHQLEQFKEMDCYSLFTSVDNSKGVYYFINFGVDYESAARMMTTILYEITGTTDLQCRSGIVKKSELKLGKVGELVKKQRVLGSASSLIWATLWMAFYGIIVIIVSYFVILIIYA